MKKNFKTELYLLPILLTLGTWVLLTKNQYILTFIGVPLMTWLLLLHYTILKEDAENENWQQH